MPPRTLPRDSRPRRSPSNGGDASMNIKHSFVAALAVSALIGAAACSATRTQRSPGEHLDDAVILGNVKAALIAEPNTSAREINVEVNRGIVQLNGFVDTPAERARATMVATEVDGVVEVRNNLGLKPGGTTLGEVIDDSLLTAKVKAALIESPETKAHQITVETKEGVVQLSGFVDSLNAKAAATTVALSVTGVKNVRNEISVKTS